MEAPITEPKKSFFYTFKEGTFEEVQKLLKEISEISRYFGLLIASKNNRIDIVKYIVEKYDITLEDKFYRFCEDDEKSVEALATLLEETTFLAPCCVVKDGIVVHKALEVACYNGSTDVIEYLIVYFNLQNHKNLDHCEGLYLCIRSGNLEAAKVVQRKIGIFYNSDGDMPRKGHSYVSRKDLVRLAFESGNSKLIEWLFEIPIVPSKNVEEIDISTLQEWLGEIGRYGHRHLLSWAKNFFIWGENSEILRSCMVHVFQISIDSRRRWLNPSTLSKKERRDVQLQIVQDIYAQFSITFEECFPAYSSGQNECYISDPLLLACYGGNENLFNWLVSTFRITKKHMMSENNWAFYQACAMGRIGMVKKVANLFTFVSEDVKIPDNLPLRESIRNGKSDVVLWLLSTFFFTKKELTNKKGYSKLFVKACLTCSFEVLELLERRIAPYEKGRISRKTYVGALEELSKKPTEDNLKKIEFILPKWEPCDLAKDELAIVQDCIFRMSRYVSKQKEDNMLRLVGLENRIE